MCFENPATGEVIEVLSESPELLGMRATWTRPGHRAVAHVHPGCRSTGRCWRGEQPSRSTVCSLSWVLAAVSSPSPGQRHLAWNPSDEEVVLRIEMRPGLRWTEFVRRLFAGEPVMPLLAEFPDEIRAG